MTGTRARQPNSSLPRRSRVAGSAGLFGTGAAAALAILAIFGSPAAAEEDISILAGSCANCHGPEGRSPGAIPSIAGEPQAVLKAQMEGFRAGEPADATVMPRLMSAYSDEEIDALARWFSEVKP